MMYITSNLFIEGWLEGIFTTVAFIFGIVSGLFFIHKSKANKKYLLSHMGILLIQIGFVYTGVILDFFSILSTGDNLDNTFGLQAVLTYMWTFPGATVAIYIGLELLFPKKKRFILNILIFFTIVGEIILFMNPSSSLSSISPVIPGTELIHTNVMIGTPLFVLVSIYFLFVVFLLDIGCIIKGIKSKGVVRKKFLLLASGFLIYHILLFFDAFFHPGIALILVRSGIFFSFMFWYQALKEQIIIPKQSLIRKEVTKDNRLFSRGFFRL
ncbi:MAG: hypothetical protein ACFFCS_12845 [Candidatus Hodarchaeota archaeon]